MADYTSHDTNTSTGDNPATSVATFKANDEVIDNNYYGTAAPTTELGNGRDWYDSTTASALLRKFRQNGAWVTTWGATATTHVAIQNVDFAGFEMVNAVLEKLATGSLSTTEARLQWDTTLNIPAWGDGTDTFYAGRAKTDATSMVRIPCSMNVATLGTPATASTATIFGGWTLDAAAEELNIVADKPIPNGWTGANDLTLEVDVLLLVAETANDDIDMDGTVRLLSDADGPGKTGTGLVAITHDIGAGNAQYDRHLLSLTIDHDDATNPVAVDDKFVATINHNAAGQVAGIIVIGATLAVPVFNFDE